MNKASQGYHHARHYLPYLLTVLLSIASNSGLSDTNPSSSRYYTLATATTGSTHYPVGVAIATLTRVKLEPHQGTGLIAISSAGSAENLQLLKSQQAQAAILQSLYGAQANLPALRAIATLWLNVEHFVVRSTQVKTGTIVDLKGFAREKFSLGITQSGAEGSGRYILKQLGIDAEESLSRVYLDYQMSAAALAEGKIAGMNVPNGVPARPVLRAFSELGEDITLLDFTDEQLRQINRHYPLWQRYTLPAYTYPTQAKPVATIAQPNFLAIRAEVPDDDVYWITRTLYENIEFLTHIHPATADLSLETALENLPVPLHPGAVRYYQALGVTIPEPLMPPLVTEDSLASPTLTPATSPASTESNSSHDES